MVLSNISSYTKQLLKIHKSKDINALLFELSQIEFLLILDVMGVFFLILVLFLRHLVPTDPMVFRQSKIKTISIAIGHLILRSCLYFILVAIMTWMLFRIVDTQSLPVWDQLYKKDLRRYVITPLLKSGLTINQINRLLNSLHLKELKDLRKNTMNAIYNTTTNIMIAPGEVENEALQMFSNSFQVLKEITGENVSQMIKMATKWLLPRVWENAVGYLPFGLNNVINVVKLSVDPLSDLNASQISMVRDLLVHNLSSFYQYTIQSYLKEIFENIEGAFVIAVGGTTFLELSNLKKAFSGVKKAFKMKYTPDTILTTKPTLAPKQKQQALSILQINQKNPNPREIRSAFLRLAVLHHPDRGGNIQKMKQLNAAYNFLLS